MSVDGRLRADMHAIGQALNPDAWTALEEVEKMAGQHAKRRNILLAMAAAAVLLVGVAAVPAVGDWWDGPSTVAAAEDGDQVAADPAVETLLDDLTTATNAGDTQAVLRLLTDDATYFGTPVAETAPGGLAKQVERYAGYGLTRDATPALVVSDGFDFAIAYRGTAGDAPILFLARARSLDEGLRIYEISRLNEPNVSAGRTDGQAVQATDPEVEAFLDDLTAAGDAGDAQAVLALLTDDATYFGTPVAETAPGGLANQVKRYARYGHSRDDAPALVVSDGFDYVIAYRGSEAGIDFLNLVRARALDDGLRAYEVSVLKGP
jgi:ketosteroid isomerase-like protein